MDGSAAQPSDPEPRATREFGKYLEAFSRDLLVLAKTLSVYPEAHPARVHIAERLVGSMPAEAPEGLTIGITPTRFLHANEFFGSDGSRIESFASLLHGKKIMRLHWSSNTGLQDVLAFSTILAGSQWTGAELAEQLRSSGVRAIRIDPLDITKIHRALSHADTTGAGSDEAAEREMETWLWLQDDSLEPEVLAQALRSEAFRALSSQNPSFPLRLLFRHGPKLGNALGHLPGREREEIRNLLAKSGNEQPVAELASIVLSEVKTGRRGGEDAISLLEGLSPERLIDLMAQVIAQSDHATPRALAFFRNLTTKFDVDRLIAQVESRQSQHDGPNHPADVWHTLRTFLLDLEEQDFFGDDYLSDLDHMSREESQGKGSPGVLAKFAEDPGFHLDSVYLGLARDEGGEAVVRLRRRIEARISVLPASALLQFVSNTTRAIPNFFLERPELAREVFSKSLADTRMLGRAERQAVIAFARTHEDAVLDLALTVLIRERRIAVRRFLVDVLSALSPETTVRMLARASDAPWYYVRNIATVLGRRRERESAPILQALLRHPHDKVRKECLKALGPMGGAARHAVAEFAKNASTTSEERRLAARILERNSTCP